MKEQLDYLLAYGNTLLTLARYAENKGNLELAKRYAKQGIEVINKYNMLKREWDTDKTCTLKAFKVA